MTVWVGRYAMVDGQVREHGPWLVDRVRRREEESLRVLVLAEPTDARSAEFCHEVAEAVAALFARESLSITGGLLRALRQAHANLAEWNRRSLREHRVAVGVTCVVVRDEEVLVAQCGPGAAYLRQGEQVVRLTTEGLPGATPLGADQPIEPLFTSGSLVGGQVLLLSANAERALGRHTIENALAAGPEQALTRIFPHTRALSDMTAVLVADLDVDEEQPVAPLDFDGAFPTDEDPADYEGREVAFTGHDGGRPAAPPVKRPRGWKLLTTEPLGDGGDGSPPRPGGRMPSIRRTRAVGRRAGQTPLVPWRTAGIVAAAALVLALLAWLVLPGLLSEDRAAELETAITAANAQLASADAAANAEATREALRNALAEAERARGLAPDDPRIAQIVADAEARLQSLDAVTNVTTLVPVLTFEGSVTAPVQPEALISGGASLWLRESGRGRVVRIDPTPGDAGADPQEVFRAAETYDGIVAREPVAIAWDASTSRLLIVDAGRALYAVADTDGAQPAVLPLRDAQEMRSVAAIAVYFGNLYVLDPAGGEVWRYLPAGDGFDSERTGILGGQDLETATDLAIDGEVFILDGAVLRHFVQGREQAPLLQGIDEPPQSAAGLVEDVLREVIYLADRGNGRIVSGTRDGAFLRQYRHPDFIDLRGVAVAPDGTALYALTGTGITAFTLQAAQ